MERVIAMHTLIVKEDYYVVIIIVPQGQQILTAVQVG